MWGTKLSFTLSYSQH